MRRLPEIEALTRQVYEGLGHEDIDAVTAEISRHDGLVWIGVEASQWWTSHETMVHVLHQGLDAEEPVTLFDADPQGYGEDGVGWVADQPRLRRRDGTDIPLRLTAVAHCEEGRWRFVQWHVSVGQPSKLTGPSKPNRQRTGGTP